MNESNRPDLQRVVVDRLIGHAERILREGGSPDERGYDFLARLYDDEVTQILGHEHPLVVEAEGAYVIADEEGGDEGGDHGIRAALAMLVARRNALPPLGRPSDPAGSAERKLLAERKLKVVGVEGGRLYFSLPVRSWCSPFARLWRLRKLARVGLVTVAVGLLVIAGFTLGWVPAIGTVAAGLVVTVVAAAILPRREPPGTAS